MKIKMHRPRSWKWRCPECHNEFNDNQIIVRQEMDHFGTFDIEYCPKCFHDNRKMVILTMDMTDYKRKGLA